MFNLKDIYEKKDEIIKLLNHDFDNNLNYFRYGNIKRTDFEKSIQVLQNISDRGLFVKHFIHMFRTVYINDEYNFDTLYEEYFGGKEQSCYFVLKENNSFRIIDLDGNEIYDFSDQYEKVLLSSINNCYLVRKKDLWGLFSSLEGEIIKPSFKEFDCYKNGKARIKKGSKWGVIDKSGKYVIKATHDWISPFENGIAIFASQNPNYARRKNVIIYPYYGFINDCGDILLDQVLIYAKTIWWPYINDEEYGFSNGLALCNFDKVNDYEEYKKYEFPKKFGYINSEFKVEIKPIFQYAEKFEGDVARVAVLNEGQVMWGLIDKKGKYIVEPKYEWIKEFIDGKAEVDLFTKQLRRETGYIAKDGTFSLR